MLKEQYRQQLVRRLVKGMPQEKKEHVIDFLLLILIYNAIFLFLAEIKDCC